MRASEPVHPITPHPFKGRLERFERCIRSAKKTGAKIINAMFGMHICAMNCALKCPVEPVSKKILLYR
jgi:hypothetical protein